MEEKLLEEMMNSPEMTAEDVETLREIDKFIRDLPGKIEGFLIALVIAIIVLVVGFKLTNLIRKAVVKVMTRRKVDQAVIHFVEATVNAVCKGCVIFAAICILGVEGSSITTIIGSCTIAIGLAVQGSLSNFAGGLLLLILKPFSVGDYIVEASTGKEGTVEHISIFYTRIMDDYGFGIVLPNGNLANSAMVNKTMGKDYRYATCQFKVSYDSDIDTIKRILLGAIESDKSVFRHDYAAAVVTEGLLEGGITMKIKVPTNNKGFLDAQFKLNEIVRDTLAANGIRFVFNQMDVHLDAKQIRA